MRDRVIYGLGGIGLVVAAIVIAYTFAEKPSASASHERTSEPEPRATASSTANSAAVPSAVATSSAVAASTAGTANDPAAQRSALVAENEAHYRELAHLTPQQAFVEWNVSGAADEENAGAVAFADWLTRFASWESVVPSPEEKTSYALVMKDQQRERGKRMCISGRVGQISVDRDSFGVRATGIIMMGFDVVRFVAAHDTGDLVKGKHAKFCGFVAGKTAYANVSGGQTQGVYMVGMFDLPSNRAIKKPEPQQPAGAAKPLAAGTTIDLTR